MNSDKRIINDVGSMGGLKTTKSSSSWEVLKKVKEEKEDSFRRREQSSLTNDRQRPCSASGIYHCNRKKPQYRWL